MAKYPLLEEGPDASKFIECCEDGFSESTGSTTAQSIEYLSTCPNPATDEEVASYTKVVNPSGVQPGFPGLKKRRQVSLL